MGRLKPVEKIHSERFMTEKEISKDDFYLDLLFYYRHLNCLVVFELLEQDMPDLERSKHKLALA